MSKIVFGIYIAGPLSRNQPSINRFREVCARDLAAGSYEIRVIDIARDPSVAEKKLILAAPTIIRERPGPERRIIGDMRLADKAERAFTYLMDGIQMRKNHEKQKHGG